MPVVLIFYLSLSDQCYDIRNTECQKFLSVFLPFSQQRKASCGENRQQNPQRHIGIIPGFRSSRLWWRLQAALFLELLPSLEFHEVSS